MTEQLREALAKSEERFNSLTPEQRAAEMQAQRESFVRAFTTPCEHGELDFETCPKCGVYGSEREQTL